MHATAKVPAVPYKGVRAYAVVCTRAERALEHLAKQVLRTQLGKTTGRHLVRGSDRDDVAVVGFASSTHAPPSTQPTAARLRGNQPRHVTAAALTAKRNVLAAIWRSSPDASGGLLVRPRQLRASTRGRSCVRELHDAAFDGSALCVDVRRKPTSAAIGCAHALQRNAPQPAMAAGPALCPPSHASAGPSAWSLLR